MTDVLLQIVSWLLPAGGFGGAFLWLTSRTLRHARRDKEVHEVYRKMYEDLSKTVIELQHDNSDLHNAIGRFEALFRRAQSCRYYGNVCPLRDKLPQLILRPHDGRNDRGTIDDTADDGGYRRPRDAYLNKREGEGGFSESELIDGEPP